MRIAGERRVRVDNNVTVDYADVLRQAVENERWRVLREVRKAVEEVATQQKKPYAREYWDTEKRDPSDVKRDALAAVDRVMNQ